ncbi:hypothetical protein H1P_3430001 [Hyella patelloides LEGE 07179]|uniref:Integrase n=1 Tax=Hyella patelloides LEGE 07179 TaxID=945734 RepID=A0A563VVU4_9CYAN|nr:hypothetical protein [Hyella patelloides]VEP15530.1 hypothetical protein H1P_3430001 [Hyella patelloides LEGE 07179]
MWHEFTRISVEPQYDLSDINSLRKSPILKPLYINGFNEMWHDFTLISAQRLPLRHIQAISGHRTLAALERYLGVTEQQKETAISTLNF